MSLAACIIRWPQTTRSPWCRYRLGRQVVLQDRGAGLLQLQEQRVVLVATLEQDDVGQRPDASDTDHLAGHVDGLELLQQLPVIVAQGGPVGAELVTEQALHLV